MNSIENFIQSFHGENPSCTPASFALGVSNEGLTSYDHIVKTIEESANANAKILDLACGDGFLLKKLRQASPDFDLFGIDMSESELQVARKNLSSLEVSLLNGKAQTLPFSDSNFDGILCHMALMLMDDIEQVISEIHRCLKAKGIFTCIVGGKFNKNPIMTQFIELLDSSLAFENKTWLRNLGDKRTRTSEGLLSLFEKNFEAIEVNDFEIHFNSQPESLLPFFMLMYDVGLLSSNQKNKLQEQFLVELEKAKDSSGRVQHSFSLRQLICRKK